jgi:hypothetical protein
MLGGAHRVFAAPAPAPTPVASSRIASLGVHEAAQFASRLYRVNVIVLGGTAATITLPLEGLDAATAMARIAKAAGLRVVRKDATFVLAPREIVATATAGRRGLPVGTRLDLDFVGVDAMNVFRTLADALKLSVDGTVRGQLSIFVKGMGALDLVGILSRLSGREASRHAGRLLVSGAFPDIAEHTAPPVCEPDLDHTSYFQCVDEKQLEAVAWGRIGDRAQIALRPKAETTPARSLIVHIGDAVGKDLARVKEIDDRGALLSDGTLIALPASQADTNEP